MARDGVAEPRRAVVLGVGGPEGQPAPHQLARQAEVFEPAVLVALDPGREDGLLPGAGGDLEALELVDDGHDPGPSLALCAGGDVLPAQEEAHEVLGGDRLDLPTQPVLGIGVDPGQQPAGAPLLVLEGGVEGPPHGEALGLEPGQAHLRPGCRPARSAAASSGTVTGPVTSRWPRTASAAATSGSRLVRPATAAGSVVGVEGGVGEERLDPPPPLGGAPQRRLGSGPVAGAACRRSDAAAARPEAARASNHAA